MYLTEEPRKRWQEISHWKQCKGEDSEATSLNYCKKRTVYIEFYTQQKYLSKMKEK